MKKFLEINQNNILFILIILLAIFLRFYGLDWDQGQHLHPDERFLTMVMTAMKMPKNLSEYLNPLISPMNPYNLGYSFFVYGVFPLNLTRVIGELIGKPSYGNIHLLGRQLSAFFDLGVILLLFLLGRKIFSEKVGLLSAFLYSIMVLPIQLSHFFAVDTFLNFFIVLSFYFLILLISIPSIANNPVHLASQHKEVRQLLITNVALGASFGLALACKISALLFLPIISFGFLICLLKSRKLKLFVFCSLCFMFCAYGLFRFSQPQAFASGNFLNLTLNPQFAKNLKELKQMSSSQSWAPPNVQWQKTTPIIFPLKNLILWGMGLPLGVISLLAIIFSIASITQSVFKKNCLLSARPVRLAKPGERAACYLLITLWILFLFFYQGVQFVKTMRYFLPIYPFLALLSGHFLSLIINFLKRKCPNYFYFLLFTSCLVLLIYPVSFISIYTKPITRVTASEWIYQNIPAGSTLLNEEWDDGLPLPLLQRQISYRGETVLMYDPDTAKKWQEINKKLAMVDYIILTSNRAYGSTMRLPQRYPQTTKYYQSLFDGTGNFKKVAEFTSYPCFPPGKYNLFCFNDDGAEEAFTVYDHPKVIIFQKDKKEFPLIYR